MSKKINIAIDGPSGAGKSTVAKEVSKKLNYAFLSSGSIYRAIALNAINKNIDCDDVLAIVDSLQNIDIKVDDKENIYLFGENVSKQIREDLVSKKSSKIAQYPDVRHFVVDFVQDITKKAKGFIMDGRDTTFKLMPHAELKIFLTGTPEERAKRRMLENKERGFETDYATVLAEVKQRDYTDINRETDPLHVTEDAILIDTTNMTFDNVVDKIINLAKERM
ncbi:(d)CMP kinase [Mycoplasmopsis primatum]|uniref:(d)CMP kinase n=1 Tax=Mycoplasmopsis primatum TaxID=55604 RepID=UPI000495A38C|nr:(d)CMP kinase [Mycoplasmopsis primatum]